MQDGKKIEREILRDSDPFVGLRPRVPRRAVHKERHDNPFWKLFIYGIIRSPAPRGFLNMEQEGFCAACFKSLPRDSGSLHHFEYRHSCQYHETVKLIEGSVPKCRDCSFASPEFFESCMSNLVLVHERCHKKIHGLDRG